MTSGKTPLQFKHIIYFNSQLFWEQQIWFSLWAIQKLSKPQHARQMHEMFGCQMARVIFVVLWSAPARRWNDNWGCFEDFQRRLVRAFAEHRVLSGRICTRLIIWNHICILGFELMAADRHIGCGGEQTYDPSWCGLQYSTSRAAAVWSLELAVIGGLSLNDEGKSMTRTNGGQARN